MRNFLFELKAYPKPTSLPRPIINIDFKNPNDKRKILKVIGIIDTGADYCTIPLNLQSQLGLDLKNMGANTIGVSCACGNKAFFGYGYKLNVTAYDTANKQFTNLLSVHFVPSDTLPLIGRNFMELFKGVSYITKEKKGHFYR